MEKKKGIFIISLDFELYWGLFDRIPRENYKENLLGVRELIPLLLNRFAKHDIHATWAIVGFLFFSNKQELLKHIPELPPNYAVQHLSPYKHLENVGENENEDPFHFGASLVNLIKDFQEENQEIGTHTFSHYYCLAEGQNMESFEADIKQSIKVAREHGLDVNSIVFPRNQMNSSYFSVCAAYGINAFRGNEDHWLYKATSKKEGLFKRTCRLLDSYFNISGHHIYALEDIRKESGIVNIPSSRFFRPYSRKLKYLESLKLKRIKDSLTKAAKEGKIYHLWWHPHNLGGDLTENIQMLDSIIDHVKRLQERYGMMNCNMREVRDMVLENPTMFAKEVIK